MGYPTEEDDQLILDRFADGNPIHALQPVISAEELTELQISCRGVRVGPEVRRYVIQLVHATREHPQVELGASPRAMLGMFRTAQALAAIRGTDYVIPDHVKYLTPFVLEHRIIPDAQSHIRGLTASGILREVLDSVPVPVEDEDGVESEAGELKC